MDLQTGNNYYRMCYDGSINKVGAFWREALQGTCLWRESGIAKAFREKVEYVRLNIIQ